MKKNNKGSVSKLDYLKLVSEIIFKIFKMGLKSYLKDQTDQKNVKIKGELK